MIRQYPEATDLQTTDAFIIDRIGVGSMFIEGSSIQVGAPYAVSFEFLGGTPPISSEVMGGHVFPLATSFAPNLVSTGILAASPRGNIETNPTGSLVITIYKKTGGVSTSIGTMTISAAGVFTFAVASAVSFAAGDSIKFVAPSGADATAANLWWTIVGGLS